MAELVQLLLGLGDPFKVSRFGQTGLDAGDERAGVPLVFAVDPMRVVQFAAGLGDGTAPVGPVMAPQPGELGFGVTALVPGSPDLVA